MRLNVVFKLRNQVNKYKHTQPQPTCHVNCEVSEYVNLFFHTERKKTHFRNIWRRRHDTEKYADGWVAIQM